MQFTTLFSISLITAIVFGKFTETANPTTATKDSIATEQVKPERKEKKTVKKIESKSKLSKAEKYIERFKKTAVQEMKQFGIPASITLAQGIVESNSGQSSLSVNFTCGSSVGTDFVTFFFGITIPIVGHFHFGIGIHYIIGLIVGLL